jgi:ADP-heptose:LPS heptosyltransferase
MLRLINNICGKENMKILFFRLGAIGDTLLTTPAVRKTRELFPDAEIHYLVGEKAEPVLKNNPHIDRLFGLSQKKHILPRELDILFVTGFLIKNFSKQQYDYFIDFESSYFSAYISLFIKAGRKIGHIIRNKRRRFYNAFYDTRVDYKDNDRYAVYRHLALIREMGGFDTAGVNAVLNLTDEEKKYGAKFYAGNGINPGDKRILLCVSSMWKSKMWPGSHWKKLIELINEKYVSCRIVILKGPDDDRDFITSLQAYKNVFVIPPDGLRALAAVMSLGTLLIANDGAVRHMAAALAVKTIGIFGPTSESGWAASDENNVVLTPPVDCRPCYKKDCPKQMDCMAMISPETIFAKLEEWI